MTPPARSTELTNGRFCSSLCKCPSPTMHHMIIPLARVQGGHVLCIALAHHLCDVRALFNSLKTGPRRPEVCTQSPYSAMCRFSYVPFGWSLVSQDLLSVSSLPQSFIAVILSLGLPCPLHLSCFITFCFLSHCSCSSCSSCSQS